MMVLVPTSIPVLGLVHQNLRHLPTVRLRGLKFTAAEATELLVNYAIFLEAIRQQICLVQIHD